METETFKAFLKIYFWYVHCCVCVSVYDWNALATIEWHNKLKIDNVATDVYFVYVWLFVIVVIVVIIVVIKIGE